MIEAPLGRLRGLAGGSAVWTVSAFLAISAAIGAVAPVTGRLEEAGIMAPRARGAGGTHAR